MSWHVCGCGCRPAGCGPGCPCPECQTGPGLDYGAQRTARRTVDRERMRHLLSRKPHSLSPEEESELEALLEDYLHGA